MPPIKKLPNSIRYLKARFSHLTKPLVWGPIGVASLVLLFAWELSVHPEWLTIDEDDEPPFNSNSLTELSSEEAAIAVDIDNSSVLNRELENNERLPVNPIVISTEDLLEEIEGRTEEKSNFEETSKPEEYFTNSELETEISPQSQTNNLLNSIPANIPQNSASQEKLKNPNLLISPLPPSVNLLDSRNQAEKKEKTVSPLKAAMDKYLDAQNKSKSFPTQKKGTTSLPYPTQNSIGNIPSSQVPNSQKPTPTQYGVNNINPPLPPINVTPPKPYYTDLSGSRNQTNNQPNLSGSNYSPQVQTTNQNIPSLAPVVPNGLVNNQNRQNGVNNWGNYHNYYGSQGLPQNQQHQYNYGVTPNQVNQGYQPSPSYDQFSRSNGFYNRTYGSTWNNPFNKNNHQNR